MGLGSVAPRAAVADGSIPRFQFFNYRWYPPRQNNGGALLICSLYFVYRLNAHWFCKLIRRSEPAPSDGGRGGTNLRARDKTTMVSLVGRYTVPCGVDYTVRSGSSVAREQCQPGRSVVMATINGTSPSVCDESDIAYFGLVRAPVCY